VLRKKIAVGERVLARRGRDPFWVNYGRTYDGFTDYEFSANNSYLRLFHGHGY